MKKKKSTYFSLKPTLGFYFLNENTSSLMSIFYLINPKHQGMIAKNLVAIRKAAASPQKEERAPPVARLASSPTAAPELGLELTSPAPFPETKMVP